MTAVSPIKRIRRGKGNKNTENHNNGSEIKFAIRNVRYNCFKFLSFFSMIKKNMLSIMIVNINDISMNFTKMTNHRTA